MENNLITEYQVIDGSAIVDREFNIIMADEQVFRFIGSRAVNVYIHSRYYTSAEFSDLNLCPINNRQGIVIDGEDSKVICKD